MAWELRKGPVLKIGLLHTGMVATDMLLAWARLERTGIPTSVSFQRDRPWDQSRNIVATEALREGCEWVLFLDTDIVFPSYTIRRLLSHNRPIVTGLYFRRHPEVFPELFKYDETGALRPLTVDEVLQRYRMPDDLIEVDGCGAGCLLVHRSVFEDLKDHVPLKTIYGEHLGNLEYYEFFKYTIGEAKRGYSEDLEFCDRVRRRGWTIVCDLRVNCGHLTQMQIRDGRVDWPPLEVGRG
ncbi:MAG: hypothetical protein QW587_04560 [Candidatus Bathyarchaeia archaeon]